MRVCVLNIHERVRAEWLVANFSTVSALAEPGLQLALRSESGQIEIDRLYAVLIRS